MAMHEKTRFIKVHIEAVLPVPYEVRDALDAVAEGGLDAMKQFLAHNMTTIVPGTLQGSWQSMPQSWAPKKLQSGSPILQERLTPELGHQIVQHPGEEEGRVTFVDMSEM